MGPTSGSRTRLLAGSGRPHSRGWRPGGSRSFGTAADSPRCVAIRFCRDQRGHPHCRIPRDDSARGHAARGLAARRWARARDRWRRVVAIQATWSQPVAVIVVFSNDFASRRERAVRGRGAAERGGMGALEGSTPHREAFTLPRHQIVSSHVLPGLCRHRWRVHTGGTAAALPRPCTDVAVAQCVRPR